MMKLTRVELFVTVLKESFLWAKTKVYPFFFFLVFPTKKYDVW